MISNENRKERIWLFVWGLIGLICIELLIYILFFSINLRFTEDSQHNIWAISWNYAYPFMGFGILFYIWAFAVRGSERKSISINLKNKSDDEKMILLGIIMKSMKQPPTSLLPWERDGNNIQK